MRKKTVQHNLLPDIQEEQETDDRTAFLDQGKPEQTSRSAPVLIRISGGSGASMDQGRGGRPGFNHLQKSYGNRATIRFMKNHAILPKLNISLPGDRYEQEADRVAEHVVRESEPQEELSDPEHVQSKSRQFQISAMGTGSEETNQNSITGSGRRNGFEHALNRQIGFGRPLGNGLRAKMEPGFGYDFSDVRIHTGRESGRLNRALNARAFTYGRDIFFGEGEFSPNTSTGRGLIGHELTHVVQQHANRHIPGIIQREDLDAGLPAGVPMPEQTEEEPAQDEFTDEVYFLDGERFDSVYIPGEPSPHIGDLEIYLFVHITFTPFTRAMMRQPDFRGHRWTREQLRDFEWTEEERETFRNDFIQNVQNAWSEQFNFCLDETDFASYTTRVNVHVVEIGDAGQAHNRITALKIPRGAPNFTSFVSGDESTLDIRDPSERRSFTGDRAAEIMVQIGPFPYGSATFTPDVISQIMALEDRIRPLQDPDETDTLLGDTWAIDYIGRASSPGGPVYNRNLGLERAQVVEQRINRDLGRPWVYTRADSRGEENTTTDERFQRVDIHVFNVTRLFTEEIETTFTQLTAAHEVGHMFGLGDEYIDEDPSGDSLRKFEGDRPTHYEDVEALMGRETADELLVSHSESIMGEGMEVRRGHYVYFLQALNDMTGRQWDIEEP